MIVIWSEMPPDRSDKLAGGIKEEDALCQSTGWPSVQPLRSHFRFRQIRYREQIVGISSISHAFSIKQIRVSLGCSLYLLSLQVAMEQPFIFRTFHPLSRWTPAWQRTQSVPCSLTRHQITWQTSITSYPGSHTSIHDANQSRA